MNDAIEMRARMMIVLHGEEAVSLRMQKALLENMTTDARKAFTHEGMRQEFVDMCKSLSDKTDALIDVQMAGLYYEMMLKLTLSPKDLEITHDLERSSHLFDKKYGLAFMARPQKHVHVKDTRRFPVHLSSEFFKELTGDKEQTFKVVIS